MYPANITRAEAALRSRIVTSHAYKVTIDLTGRDADGRPIDQPDALFASTSEIHFDSTAGTTTLNLIAERLVAATLDGRPIDDYDGEHLALDLTEGSHDLVVTALCRYSRTGEGLHRFVDPADGGVYCYTQFETADARRAYACFEQPDLKASFTLSVIAPEGWTVVSNAAEVEPTPLGEGRARWDFWPTPPISTYITALCAGPFHRVADVYHREGGDVQLSVLCRQSSVEYLDAERILATTKAGFAVFEEKFATPYPFADYAQVFVPEFNAGAMENAGCVTLRDEYLFRGRVTQASYEGRDNTILHELAHMWFGDLVSMRWWDDLWLNESFAEWASHYCQSVNHERTGVGDNPWATFCNKRKTWAYRADQLPSTHPVAADMVDLEAVELNFDGITYAKGASVLKQLVAFVGTEDFLAGVQTYFRRHGWGNTELNDLLLALEEASGRDLSHFGDEWLKTTGVNTITADFDTDADGRFTGFALRQTAPDAHPTLRHHRLAVGLYDHVDGALRRVDWVEVDIEGPVTEVPALVGVARPALVLPNDDDLTYAKVRLDAASMATLVSSIDELDDPLARALCWGAAWDMCRDGELAAADYVDLVLRGVAGESDQTAVSAVLGQAHTALDYYAPRAERPRLRGRLVAGIAGLVRDAEPGSDHQVAFAQALSRSADGPAAGAVLQAWLDGTEVPEGLVVDEELRWLLVTDLARLGIAGEAEIAAQLERDDTSSGREHAAGARAARPDADAKAAAWGLATGPDLPANEIHYQTCASFWQFDQDEVLAPYASRYLDVIAALSAQDGHWADASSVLRQHVTRLLFPRPLADRAYLDHLDAWMRATPLTESVVRVLTECRDDAERALRCQQGSEGVTPEAHFLR